MSASDESIQARLLARWRQLQEAGDTDAVDTEQDETPDELAERLARKRATWENRWRASVPPLYATASFADLDDSQRLAWPDDSLNLVLAGSVGTGKTHAAYAIGNDLAARGVWVAGATVSDLLDALRPSGDQRTASDARACQVLVLDDLGATKVSDFAVEQMTALLDHRISHGRRTVVTTNVPEPELQAAWGSRFTDRLRYRWTVKVMTGESRRKAAF